MTTPLAHHVMDAAEVTTLLARISAFDARTVGQSEVQAWTLIAQRGKWTLAEATEQVINYFALDEPGWLMPGRINTMIRMARQDSLERRPVAPLDRDADEALEQETRTHRDSILALWAAAKLEAKRVCQARRALVLHYPDLADQLKSNLIGYSRPENWNGYIPPEYDPPRRDGTVPLNDSPRRAALVALVEEAERRAAAEGEGT